MNHLLCQVCAVEVLEPYTLRVQFTDNTEQVINLNRFLLANSTAHCSTFSYSTKWLSTQRSKLWSGRTALILIPRRSMIGPSTKRRSPPAPGNGNVFLPNERAF